ncbi:MAG: winged helix-turn-helix domain-containing protein [Bryobacteraceae bacterium]
MSGELVKSGTNIRLQPQPAHLLTLLLRQAGEIVTREAIRAALWETQTTVDYELGMNRCVRELRGALVDDANAPIYIQTIPRRGYCFIAPVSVVRSQTEAVPKEQAPDIPAVPGRPPLSIVVLPFANLGGDSGDDRRDEYFGDGLAEEITNSLVQIPGLRVIARTSAFAFKGRNEDIRKIAETLGVSHVLEGSVRRAGTRLRVIAQLIRADDGSQLSSKRYDHEATDLFAVQDEISADVASQLKMRLTLHKRPDVNPAAREAYLEGRFHWYKFTPSSFSRAFACYRRAAALAPDYAQALTGIAEFYIWMSIEAGTPPRTTLPKAAAAARRALDRDETDADAHAALGEVAAMLDYDWSTAAKHFRHARELSSGTNLKLRYLLWYLLPQGRVEEAVAESQDVMSQDPLFPLAHTSKATALFLGGSYEQAADRCLHALTNHPDFSPALQIMVAIRTRQGRFEEAFAWAHRLLDIVGRSYVSLSSLGIAHAATGNHQAAHRLLQEMNLQLHGASGFATAMACIHGLLGEKDAAFQWMNRAIARRDPRMLWIRTLPWLDCLRSDPRFFDLLRQMNLDAIAP